MGAAAKCVVSGTDSAGAAADRSEAQSIGAVTAATRTTPAASGRGGSGGGSGRSARAILAESWREDADLGEVVWALTKVFGPPFLASLPQPPALVALNI